MIADILFFTVICIIIFPVIITIIWVLDYEKGINLLSFLDGKIITIQKWNSMEEEIENLEDRLDYMSAERTLELKKYTRERSKNLELEKKLDVLNGFLRKRAQFRDVDFIALHDGSLDIYLGHISKLDAKLAELALEDLAKVEQNSVDKAESQVILEEFYLFEDDLDTYLEESGVELKETSASFKGSGNGTGLAFDHVSGKCFGMIAGKEKQLKECALYELEFLVSCKKDLEKDLFKKIYEAQKEALTGE